MTVSRVSSLSCEIAKDTTLEERRIRGDLIETFKMVKGISKVDHTKFFLVYQRTTEHEGAILIKLEKKM